jgi:hypothetical protein
MVKIIEKEFKILVLKLINDFKYDSTKHMTGGKKLIKDVGKNSARK